MSTDRNGPIASAWQKLDRAREHADEVQREIETWRLDAHAPPWVPTREFDADQNKFTYYVGFIQPFPIRWSMLLGDTMTNLRAALDHLAYHLVSIGDSPPITERDERAVQFPIAVKPADWRGQVVGRLPGVRDTYLAIVERHQPYHWGTDLANLHPFVILDEFVRKDKHRTLQIVGVRPGDSSFYPYPTDPTSFMPEGIEAGTFTGGAVLKPGAKVVSVYGRRVGHGEPDMGMDLNFVTSIALENGVFVGDLLEWTIAAVMVLLAEFDTLLWSGHRPEP